MQPAQCTRARACRFGHS